MAERILQIKINKQIGFINISYEVTKCIYVIQLRDKYFPE